jgi:hypothetical protein
MVRHDQAGFAEQKIEGKILQTMKGVPAREDREATIRRNCNIPDIPNSSPDTGRVHWNCLGVDRGKKTVAFESVGTTGGENPLRKDHDWIVMDACPSLVFSHSGLSQLRSVVQHRCRGVAELGSDMVTTVD